MSLPIAELPQSVEYGLCRGLIAILTADHGFTYHDDGSPFPDDYTGTATVLAARPDKPDRLISVTPYAVSDDVSQAVSTIGVQMWLRYAGRNPRAVDNLAAAIRDSLHGLTWLTLTTGVTLSQAYRTSSASLGQDPQGRWSRVENYYADVAAPSAHRE